MRIAIVSRELAPFHGGGVGTYAAALARALVAAGHGVELVTENRLRHDPTCAVDGRLRVRRVSVPGGEAHWLRTLGSFSAAAAARVGELHASDPIDVVEFPDTEAPAGAMLLGRACGVFGLRPPGVVVSVHAASAAMEATGSSEMGDAYARGVLNVVERMALHAADAVTCPSAAYAEWVASQADFAPPPVVVPNLLEWPHRAGGVSPAARTVLYVGRLEPGKGVEDLVLAWNRTHLSRDGWRLRLVGGDTKTGPEGTSMRAHLDSLAGEGVVFAGRVARHDLADEIADAAFAVVPSRWENFPYSCAEVLASGRVAIVTDGGGTSELLHPEFRGTFVVRAGDVDALAEALRRTAVLPTAELSALGARCAVYVRELCDPQQIVARRVALYEHVAGVQADRPKVRAAMLAAWKRLEHRVEPRQFVSEFQGPRGRVGVCT